MRLELVVVTKNHQLSKVVGTKQTSLISEKIIQRADAAGIDIRPTSVVVDCAESRDALEFFEHRVGEVDAIVVILDSQLRGLAEILQPAILVNMFTLSDPNPNFQNILRGLYKSSLEVFLEVSRRFKNLQYRKILMLPKRNFLAPEMKEIFLSLSAENLSQATLEAVDANLKKMRSRQTPKTETAYKNTYFRDIDGSYFEFGHEAHAEAGTKRPPHDFSCKLNSNFRFGNRISRKQQYNVSSGSGNISRSVINCHGEKGTVGPSSHINLFPNDYYC